MAIDKFSKLEFEIALPHHKETGKPLCTELGLINGEFCYALPIDDATGVMIRSSIDASGFAADTGEDSIRLWVCDVNGKPLMGKEQAYTTRVKGWDKRLTKQLRELWKLGHYVRVRPACNVERPKLRTCKKGKPENIGKRFAVCQCGKYFEWVKE